METKDFVMGFAAGKTSGVRSVFAFIVASYTVGNVCTASDGVTTLTAIDTSGFYVFPVPNAGLWHVSDGEYSKDILITQRGQSETVTIGVNIVPWATGTDEEIVAILEAAHAGKIDLQQDAGWSVGDVRTITTTGSFSNGAGGTVAVQDVDLLITSFDDYNSCGCVMQFDFKDCLGTSQKINQYSGDGSNSGGYANTYVYKTTMPNLVTVLPTWLKNKLITFDVLASEGNNSSVIATIQDNKLALRSEVEMRGLTTYSFAGEGAAIPYYSSASNRIKNLGRSGNPTTYWLRSPGKNTSGFANITNTGDGTSNRSYQSFGISPFGCL